LHIVPGVLTLVANATEALEGVKMAGDVFFDTHLAVPVDLAAGVADIYNEHWYVVPGSETLDLSDVTVESNWAGTRTYSPIVYAPAILDSGGHDPSACVFADGRGSQIGNNGTDLHAALANLLLSSCSTGCLHNCMIASIDHYA